MKYNFKKAKRQAEKKHRPWYIFKAGKWECFFFLVPLIPFAELSEQIKTRRYNNLTWSEEKAKKVLDKTLPKALDYDTNEDEYYFGLDWNARVLIKNTPIRWKAWTDKFSSTLYKYLKDTYENKDYTKTIEDNYNLGTWVIFKEKV